MNVVLGRRVSTALASWAGLLVTAALVAGCTVDGKPSVSAGSSAATSGSGPSYSAVPTPQESRVLCDGLTAEDVLRPISLSDMESRSLASPFKGCSWEFDDGKGAHGVVGVNVERASSVTKPKRGVSELPFSGGTLTLVDDGSPGSLAVYSCVAIARFDGRPESERIRVHTTINQQAEDAVRRNPGELCMRYGPLAVDAARALGWIR